METQNEVELQDLPADVRAELKAGHVAAFNRTESALAALKESYDGVVYDVATAQGLTEAKAARKDIVTHRTSLEKKRVEIKAPYIEYGRLLDSEAKRITAELESLEKPIDAQIKSEEKRLSDIQAEKDRIEAARVNAHQNNLENIRGVAGSMIGADLDVLRITLAKLQSIKFSEYEELEESAKLYAEAAVDKLNTLIEQKEAKIKADAEAVRIAVIQAKLNAIQNSAIQAIGSSSDDIEKLLYRLENIDFCLYDEFLETAKEYAADAISKVNQIRLQFIEKSKADEAAAALAKEQAEKQREQDRINGIQHRIQLISAHAQNLHRYSLETVKHNLKELAATELLEDSFGEFFEQAIETKNGVIECLQNYIAVTEKANADAEELRQFKEQKARDEKAAIDAQKAKDAEAQRVRLTDEENKELADEFVADIIVEAFEEALECDQAEPSKEAEVTRAQVITLVSDIYSLTKDEAENILKILFAN